MTSRDEGPNQPTAECLDTPLVTFDTRLATSPGPTCQFEAPIF